MPPGVGFGGIALLGPRDDRRVTNLWPHGDDSADNTGNTARPERRAGGHHQPQPERAPLPAGACASAEPPLHVRDPRVRRRPERDPTPALAGSPRPTSTGAT